MHSSPLLATAALLAVLLCSTAAQPVRLQLGEALLPRVDPSNTDQGSTNLNSFVSNEESDGIFRRSDADFNLRRSPPQGRSQSGFLGGLEGGKTGMVQRDVALDASGRLALPKHQATLSSFVSDDGGDDAF